MRKLIIWTLFALAVFVAGWLVVESPRPAPATEERDWTPQASFACADGSYFTAAFPTDDAVSILIDGEVVRILPRATGVGQRYEDNGHAYVFAGEEVVVTQKESNVTTTCTQPLDPNNAPLNFGDAGEGGAAFQDIGAIAADSLLGTWRSADDQLFIREFTEDGKVTDIYNNEITSTGIWTVFTADTREDASISLEAGAAYLEITDDTGVLTFKIAAVTPEALELIYLERGGTLSFTRIP